MHIEITRVMISIEVTPVPWYKLTRSDHDRSDPSDYAAYLVMEQQDSGIFGVTKADKDTRGACRLNMFNGGFGQLSWSMNMSEVSREGTDRRLLNPVAYENELQSASRKRTGIIPLDQHDLNLLNLSLTVSSQHVNPSRPYRYHSTPFSPIIEGWTRCGVRWQAGPSNLARLNRVACQSAEVHVDVIRY